MKVIRYPQYNPLTQASVITIGNFDGLHVGHQTLIKQVVAKARSQKKYAVVVTMQPMASQFFRGKDKVAVLTPFKQKYQLIKRLGVDVMCVLNFNSRLAGLSAEAFIELVLIKGLNAEHIMIGDDFRFGQGRLGDFSMLQTHCQPQGIAVDAMSSVLENQQRVSSSLVRRLLAKSDFKQVETLLGRPYSIAGRVTKGQQLGRDLGYPTINIRLKNRTVPVKGIFCVLVVFKQYVGQFFYGSASLGTRPTVNGIEQILEVFILDFDQQVYGEEVEVLFCHKLRNEVKFKGIEELKRHIDNDVIKTRLFFENDHE